MNQVRGNLREQLRLRMRQVLDLDDTPALETPRWATGDLLEQELRRAGCCRLCDRRPGVQLVDGEGRAEYLCLEHLGDFIATWADPRKREWTIIRL